jgi:SulP family sulfate permease
VQQYGVQGLTVATIMAGAMLIVLGVVRMGAAIKFIPFPVTMGFTSGIAVVIASGQIRDLLGLSLPAGVPADFIEKWRAYAEYTGTVSPQALMIAVAAGTILIVWPRISRTIPGPLVAVVATPLPWRCSSCRSRPLAAASASCASVCRVPSSPCLPGADT